MFDIGLPELLLIGIVALIVIGPKDLPGLFQTLGRFTAKARRMARDFQSAMNDAAKDSGMQDTAADLKNMTSAKNLGLNTLKDAADRFDKWEPGKDSGSENSIGENTAALKAEREAEAKARRDEAVAKANARAAEGFEAPKPAEGEAVPEPAAEAAETPAAPASKDAT